MPVVSEKYSQERAARAQALLDRLKALDAATLTTAEQLDVFIVKDRLEQIVADAKFKSYLVPVSDDGGFHSQFANDLNQRAFSLRSYL